MVFQGRVTDEFTKAVQEVFTQFPWVAPALIAIVLAFLSAYLTLRGNIRQRAWLIVYREKREEIRRFLQTLDEFASVVLVAGEVIDVGKRSPPAQFTGLVFWARKVWGPDPARGKDPVGREFMKALPTPQQVTAGSPGATAKLQATRMMLLNALEEKLQNLHLSSGRLRTTLALSLRDPDVTPLADRKVVSVYEDIHATTPAYQNFDFEKFADEWSRDITPVKLALRHDLNKSSRGLASALRLSWRWRIRHSRVMKWWRNRHDP